MDTGSWSTGLAADYNRQPPAYRPAFAPAAANEAQAHLLGQVEDWALRSVLDHVQFGVAVVGARLALLFANKAARRECTRTGLLCVDGERLGFPAPGASLELEQALAAARRGRWSLVQLGDGERRLMLAVLPLAGGARGGDEPVLLMFGTGSASAALATEFYARACALTPAESRVLQGLREGLSPRQLAERHAVALSTVRTQIGSLRSKTGARSILDLLRTVASLPPIMPAVLHA